MKLKSLQSKMLFFIVLPVLAALCAGIWGVYGATRSIYERAVVYNLQHQVESYANDFNGFLLRRLQIAVDVSNMDSVTRLLATAKSPLEDRSADPLFISTLGNLRKIRDSDPERTVTQVFLGVEKTNETYYDNWKKRKGDNPRLSAAAVEALNRGGYEYTNGYRLKERFWYKWIRSAGGPIFTTSYVDSSSHKVTVSALAPVKDKNGAWLGSAGVDIEVGSMGEKLSRMQLHRISNFYAFVINHAGYYVYHPDPSRIDLGPDSKEQANTVNSILKEPDMGLVAAGRKMLEGAAGHDVVPVTLKASAAGREISLLRERSYVFYAPLRDARWSVGIVVPEKEVLAPMSKILWITAYIAAAGAALLVFCTLILKAMILKPIHAMSRAMQVAEKGDFAAAETPVTSEDEIGRMERVYNGMLRQIRERDSHLRGTLNVFRLFVPAKFTDRIAKEGIESIKAGLVEPAAVSILFSDIRGFTTMSEKMTPQEVFTFLNEYMEPMSRAIRENGGFIDKFIGDAIMAIFDNFDSHQAVGAAVGMMRSLESFNAARKKAGLEPVASGAGINTGNVVMGTVGGADRLNTTVIGDPVNVASRLEALTKTYKARILISNTTYNAMSARHVFDIREIDSVAVRGKVQTLPIYEVFSADPPEIRDAKQKSLPKFKEALAAFRALKFSDAAKLFGELNRDASIDPLPAMYLQRIEESRKAVQL